MATTTLRSLPTNDYGNVDVTGRVPQGYVHVPGKRLGLTAKAAGIAAAPALTGWTTGRWARPVIDGVVVRAEDEPALRKAISQRDANRKTPAQRAAARRDRQRRDTEALAQEIRARFPGMPANDVSDCAEHAAEIGSKRCGRVSALDDAATPAVVAYARHVLTPYDALLARGVAREDARATVASEIQATLTAWRTAPTGGEP